MSSRPFIKMHGLGNDFVVVDARSEPFPLTDALAKAIADRRERIATGLVAVYGWYQRNESLAGCVTRDSEHHALTREMAEMRNGPAFAAYHAVLGDGLGPAQHALLALALGFHTWRALVRGAGMTTEDAANLMAGAIACAGGDA